MSTADNKGPLEGLFQKFVWSMGEARGSLDRMESIFFEHMDKLTMQQNERERLERASMTKGISEIAEWQQKYADLQAKVEGERASKECRPLPHKPVGDKPAITRPTKCSQPPLAQINNRQERLPASTGWRNVHESFLDTPQEDILRDLAAPLLSLNTPAFVGVLFKDRKSTGPAIECNRGFISPQGKLPASSKREKAPTFKFNEVIRNKREHDALQATDCKLCKRFYDAVDSGDGTTVKTLRCDHLKASSRHRYKSLPPETPEGFWNISFDDSEAPAS